ncbi:MAG: FAD-binding oxidoreductase [Chromatiales bacterium]|nr:FAD-binding oxidoreductase [Chromatiales bacterium]
MNVGIIGAGIVGLSSALWLQRAGYRVTLIDSNEPGQGASFGNAGLFADYARLPFARFAMMRKMPGMLIDNQSPLSLQSHYLPDLLPYGWHFFKACFPANYSRGRQALTALQALAPEADRILLKRAEAEGLVRKEGCLGLFETPEGYEEAKAGDLHERRDQGVNLQFLSADEVRELEPGLAGFHAGGVFYPDTRFTISPVELSRRYAECFEARGGCFLRERVGFVDPLPDGVRVQTSMQSITFDHLVVAAGMASKWLSAQLGIKIPMVSERGYHLMLENNDTQLNRPVGWLDKAVFLTPMIEGIRLAGTAEFAGTDAPPSRMRTNVMLQHAKKMLGGEPTVKASWVGSRPSTPDSLPVIGPLRKYPQITLAFGHGHLGLTLASVTGQLVAQTIQGTPTAVEMEAFSPERFQ